MVLSRAAGSIVAPGIAFVVTALYVPWMPEPDVARWGVVIVAALLACLPLWRAKFDRIDLAALTFAAWCGLSVTWSPDRGASLTAFVHLFAVVLIFLGLRRIETRWVIPAALAGMVSAFFAGLAFAGFGNPEFLVQFALVALPQLFPFGWVEGVAILAALVAIVFSPSLLPLTLALGIPALVKAWLVRAALVSALLAIGAVFLAHSTEAQIGVGTRLDMLAGTIAAWFVHPFTGWGIGSFVYVFPSYQGAGSAFGLIPLSVEASTYANAAHNDVLQLGMETGLVGLTLGAWLLVEVWRGQTATAPKVALGIAFILCLTGFPMQSPVTVLAVAVAASRASPTGLRWSGLPLAVAGAVAMSWALVTVPADVLAQAHFSAATRFFARDVIVQKAAAVAALSHAAQAYELDPSNSRIRLAVFQAAALTYERFPDPQSRNGVEAAWAIAQSASPADTLSLLTRLQLLIVRKECFDNRECDRIAAELVRTAARKAEVRRLVEVYG